MSLPTRRGLNCPKNCVSKWWSSRGASSRHSALFSCGHSRVSSRQAGGRLLFGLARADAFGAGGHPTAGLQHFRADPVAALMR